MSSTQPPSRGILRHLSTGHTAKGRTARERGAQNTHPGGVSRGRGCWGPQTCLAREEEQLRQDFQMSGKEPYSKKKIQVWHGASKVDLLAGVLMASLAPVMSQLPTLRL